MYRHLRGKQRGFYLQSLSFSDYKAVVNCRLICAVAVGLKCCNNLRNLAYSILYSIRQWVLSVFQCSYYWKMHNLVVRTKAITKTFGVAKLLLISNFWGSGFGSVLTDFPFILVGFCFFPCFPSRLLFSLRQKASTRRRRARQHNTLISETRVSGRMSIASLPRSVTRLLFTSKCCAILGGSKTQYGRINRYVQLSYDAVAALH